MILRLRHVKPVQFVLQQECSATRQSTSRSWYTSRHCPVPKDTATSTGTYPVQQCCRHSIDISSAVDAPYTPNPRRQEEAVHQMVQEEAQGQEQVTSPIHPAMHTQEEEVQGLITQEEDTPPGGGSQAIQAAAPLQFHHHLQGPLLHSYQEEQVIQAVLHRQHLQFPSIDPWASLDRSRKSLKLSLPSNYRSCSILDMQQMLEVWYDKSTFAIATWQGDAQRYWLTQVLDLARARRDQWLQSTPAQRATLEPAYTLGDRKHIPEAPNAVKSVLRTELLEVIPKSLAEACMRHGYCTAELIVWYVMKQLILPPDIRK